MNKNSLKISRCDAVKNLGKKRERLYRMCENREEMQKRQKVCIEKLQEAIGKHEPADEYLWEALVAFQGEPFKTVSGLPFQYTIRPGKRGTLTKELWIDRREGSKSLSFGSIRLAFTHALTLEVVLRPKAMGDIRGVSYMYPIFWRFGIIRVPKENADRMRI